MGEKISTIYNGGDEFRNGVYPDEWHYRPSYSLPTTTREIVNGWKCCPLIASVVLSKEIAEGVKAITGWRSVRVGQDDIIWKPPEDRDWKKEDNNTTVGFHQDSAYISSNFVPYLNSSVTLWLAMDDSDSGNGGLSYAEGSHKWKMDIDAETGAKIRRKDKSEQTFMGSDSSTYATPVISAALDNGVTDVGGITVTPEVRAGGGLLHNQDTWHGSGTNTSGDRHRRAIAIHYVNGDCKFRPTETKGEKPWGDIDYIYGRYRRFGSDELDGSFFPIVAGKGREEWIDDWIEIKGVGEGFRDVVEKDRETWGRG